MATAVGSSSAIRIVAPLRCDELSSALLQSRAVSARYYLVAVLSSAGVARRRSPRASVALWWMRWAEAMP